MDVDDGLFKAVDNGNLIEDSNKRESSTRSNDDLAFDGMWPFSGYDGMMIRLAEDFVRSLEQHEGEDEYNKDEFLYLRGLDPSNAEAVIQCQADLHERDLHLAAGVLRRLVEGCCPPKIRIRRLDEETTMRTLLELKIQGNYHFGRYEFREAIEYYDSALSSLPEGERDLFVAPRSQVQQIVNILSNKAECLLRRAKYEDAAEVATDALIFMGSHEKSRIRRAKAGLEVGKYDRYEATCRGDGSMTGVAYLVQAKYDLEEVLNGPESSRDGRETAEEVLSEVEKLLKGAKKKVLSKDPTAEWDLSVLKIQSRCW